MGLGIVVGILADLADVDSEGVDVYHEYFERVNKLLTKNKLLTHTEPEVLPRLDGRCELDSFPYSFLHYLRRAYAYRVADPMWMATPFPEGEKASADPVVDAETMHMKSHLLCHSDAEGFYVPIDFDAVLVDEDESIPGGMVGSSYRLMDELVYVAPALGIRLRGSELPDEEAEALNRDSDTEEGIWRERIVWLSLFEAARLSIKHRTAICFS